MSKLVTSPRFGVGIEFEKDEYVGSNHFEVKRSSVLKVRIIAQPRGSCLELLLRLIDELREPLILLYVVMVGNERDLGRHESEPMSRDSVRRLLMKHRDLFEQDSGHNLWIYSPGFAQIVWDRHELVFLYGQHRMFKKILLNLGMRPGRARIAAPHFHRYKSDLWPDRDVLLKTWSWTRTELMPEDDD